LRQQLSISRREQAVVAHFNEAVRQDVLQEAADELFSGEGAVLELVGGRVFVSESDLAVFQLDDAAIAESDAKDVRSEILEGFDFLSGARGSREILADPLNHQS
jgi:hypothetical protein